MTKKVIHKCDLFYKVNSNPASKEYSLVKKKYKTFR